MGNTLASEMHHGHQQSSSSNTENMNKNKSTTPRRGSPPPPSLPPALGLLRKGSSFLDAPITHKLTERGDATVSLSCSNRSISSTSSGREGSDSSSSDDASNSSYDKLRYAVSEMQGWRSHMEDKHALNPDLSVSDLSTNAHQKQQHAKLLEDHHLFAVFDGHGGDFASQYCGTHLVETLTSQKDWVAYLQLCDKKKNSSNQASVKGLQLLKSALTSTFLSLDEQLMTAQRKIRVSQLSKMENLVASYGGKPKEHDVFTKGTADYERIMNFDRQLPASMPPGIPLERSGSTGVVVLLTPTHIICANAGDSRAILGKKKQQKGSSNDDGVLPLSFDHKPANDVEVSRVEKDGGFVRNGRVDGDLAVSRSFGDFGYKNCSERLQMFERQKSNGSTSTASTVSSSSMSMSMSTPSQHRVAVHPDILVYTRDPFKDEFVVLACDGIWDRLTNKDCSDLVKSLIHDDGETDIGLVCEEVIDTALELDSRDNMTCCVVLFPGHQQQNHLVDQPSSQSLSSSASSGVMKRRYEREQSWGRDSTPAKRAQHRLEERRKHHRELLAQQKAKLTVTNKIQVLRGRASSVAAATASSIPSKKARLVSPMKNKKTESDGTTRQ